MRQNAIWVSGALLVAAVGCGEMPEEGGLDSASAELSARVCTAPVACDAAPPRLPTRGFAHVSSSLAAFGSSNHRVRDLVVHEGETQWLLGKFAYGVNDKDIHDETVEVYVQRGCTGGWEKLGEARTTNDGDHATVAGVEDTGGRVYFEVPTARALGLGRHRIWMSVAGDRTGVEGMVDVVPADAKFFVSDVDGTLTESEDAELGAFLTGTQSAAQPDAARLFHVLVARGYIPVYVTARAERLTARTRAFLSMHGFPQGAVLPSTSHFGLRGADAAAFKSAELDRIARVGTIAWAFGNTDTDSQAYEHAGITATRRVLYRFADPRGGRSIRAYADLLPEATALAPACGTGGAR